MRIERFVVTNYKGFDERGAEGTLTAGINVVIGQNNVGKTALLEAIAIKKLDVPHRSLATHPTPDAASNARPTVELDVRFDAQEVLEILADRGGHFMLKGHPNDGNVLNRFRAAIAPTALFRLFYGGKGEATLVNFADGEHFVHFDIARPDLQPRPVNDGRNDHAVQLIHNVVPERIYLFGAERFNVGQSGFGASSVLAPNAGNLPEVINVLHANPAKLEKLNALVNRVLPQVRWVSAQAQPNGVVRLLVWARDPKQSREDLEVPLANSGTGIGQVLAILYVVTEAIHPQVIIIDEPQTFLHPGAVRKLLEILREYPQHQFIISTHSPTALTAADPSTVLLVRQKDGVSSVQPSNLRVAKDTKAILADVGARLEDVFGFDRVLWVEGKTEELCFPIVLQRLSKRRVAGTAIVGLTETGDFEARQGDLAFAVYRKLSAGTLLVPPTAAFVFDTERRTPQQVADLKQKAGAVVHFLPRRMYENYLLDPDAIAAVAGAIDNFGGVTADAVGKWIEEHRWDDQLFKPGPVPVVKNAETWIERVRAARLLETIFTVFSETRVSYDKAKHGVELTEWLVENKPEALRPLADFLAGLLPAE